MWVQRHFSTLFCPRIFGPRSFCPRGLLSQGTFVRGAQLSGGTHNVFLSGVPFSTSNELVNPPPLYVMLGQVRLRRSLLSALLEVEPHMWRCIRLPVSTTVRSSLKNNFQLRKQLNKIKSHTLTHSLTHRHLANLQISNKQSLDSVLLCMTLCDLTLYDSV